MSFLTITYPDEFPIDNPDEWNRHFESWRKRFERAFPAARAIWRQELKPRQTGENRGKIAPHWHLLVFWHTSLGIRPVSACRALELWAKKHWYQIAHAGDKHAGTRAAECSPVRSRRHAMRYIGKYVAKQEDDDKQIGRRWGRIGSFNNEESIEIALRFDQYLNFRRLLRRWMRGRSRDYSRRLARMRPALGCTAYGLGDEKPLMGPDVFDSVAFRMLMHAIEITDYVNDT